MMDMFLAPFPIVYIFRSYLVLQEYVVMLITSLTLGIFLTARLLKQGNRYHKVRKLFLNSTTYTQS